MLDQTTDEGTIAMLLNAGPLLDELARIAFADNRLVIGSSANISLRGVKFRADDIEPEIREAADIVVDYGLSRWNRYGKSSTMIDVDRMRVVRYGSCFDLIDDLLARRFGISLPPDPVRLSLPSIPRSRGCLRSAYRSGPASREKRADLPLQGRAAGWSSKADTLNICEQNYDCILIFDT